MPKVLIMCAVIYVLFAYFSPIVGCIITTIY